MDTTEETHDEEETEENDDDETEKLRRRLEEKEERVNQLRDELDEREEHVEELESRVKRVQADFKNYKKRAKKKREEVRERATEELVERLLGVRDDFDRALEADEEEDTDAEDLREGVEMIRDKLDGILRDEGVERVDTENGSFDVVGTDGEVFTTRNRPVLATGFESGLGPAGKHFEFDDDDDDRPQLTQRDESTIASGLFLVGPQVAHNGQQFCFIYKFRQRFAVVDEIAARLDVDRAPLEEYREKQMFLEDLSCCEPDMCDC